MPKASQIVLGELLSHARWARCYQAWFFLVLNLTKFLFPKFHNLIKRFQKSALIHFEILLTCAKIFEKLVGFYRHGSIVKACLPIF